MYFRERGTYPRPKKSGKSWHNLLASDLLPQPLGPHRTNMGYGVSVLGRVLKTFIVVIKTVSMIE